MLIFTLKQTNKQFTMTFQSAETPFKVWNDPDRVQRYTRFFGPGVVATVEKRDAEKRLVALKLRTASDEAVEQFLMDYNSSPAAATEITEVAAATATYGPLDLTL